MEGRSIYRQEITAGGGTFTYVITDPYDTFHLYTSGAVVLAGNVTIAYSGTAREGQTFMVYADLTNVTMGANTFTILGEPILGTTIENTAFTAIARYSTAAAKFVVTVHPDFEGTAFIATSHLIDRSVTTAKIDENAVTFAKLQDFTGRGYLLRGGAAGAPEEFNAVTSGQLVMGNGTDVTSVAMSGDVTINGSGVTTIGAGKVTPSMLSFSLSSYLEAELTIATADVLTLNATPITIVASPGSGKYIEVISASSSITFNSAAYAANTTLQLINDGADVAQLQDTAVLIATVSKNTKFKDVTSATAGQTQIIANTALQVAVATGDPTTGDSDITIRVQYRIIEV